MNYINGNVLSDTFSLRGVGRESCVEAFNRWSNSVEETEIDLTDMRLLEPIGNDSYIEFDGQNVLVKTDDGVKMSGNTVHLEDAPFGTQQNAVLVEGAFSEDTIAEDGYLVGSMAWKSLGEILNISYLSEGIGRVMAITEKAVKKNTEVLPKALYVCKNGIKKLLCFSKSDFSIPDVEDVLGYFDDSGIEVDEWSISHEKKKISGKKGNDTYVVSWSDTGYGKPVLYKMDKKGRIKRKEKIEL